MSRERARRREERERAQVALAAARTVEAQRQTRKDARRRALTSWLPTPRARPAGVLAERRRRQTQLTVLLVLVINLLVWFAYDNWAARALAIAVSLLVAPVLHTLLFRK